MTHVFLTAQQEVVLSPWNAVSVKRITSSTETFRGFRSASSTCLTGVAGCVITRGVLKEGETVRERINGHRCSSVCRKPVRVWTRYGRGFSPTRKLLLAEEQHQEEEGAAVAATLTEALCGSQSACHSKSPRAAPSTLPSGRLRPGGRTSCRLWKGTCSSCWAAAESGGRRGESTTTAAPWTPGLFPATTWSAPNRCRHNREWH